MITKKIDFNKVIVSNMLILVGFYNNIDIDNINMLILVGFYNNIDIGNIDFF